MSENPFADQNDNPYKPPVLESRPVVGLLTNSRENLRAVAGYQKGIILCILVYLILAFGQFALPPELRILVAVAVLAAGVIGTVFVFLLATKVYGTGWGVVLGILTLIPCLGLLVLLIINGQATGLLRANGIRVGLLGADMSQV